MHNYDEKDVVNIIYLDNAATTKIDGRVLEAMMPYLTDEYGNAGTLYRLGRQANDAVQKARKQVADLIGVNPEQIIFTSGGSEANNLVFRGVKDHLKKINKTHILVSAVEHDSVLRAAESLIKEGFRVDYIPVSQDGEVSVESVRAALTNDTGLVSVMAVNNETGRSNPIFQISNLCQTREILFHTDCVQAVGDYHIDAFECDYSFVSISSHKIYGPKGVGALYVADKSLMSPIIYGGSDQEFGLRAGTENVAGIVGFGKACELIRYDYECDYVWCFLYELRERFLKALTQELKSKNLEGILHIHGNKSLGRILNLGFDGVDAQTLLLMLDNKGVCVSAGSACCSHENKPSHVLKAMGLSDEEARSSIRVSFSKANQLFEVGCAARTIAECVEVLKEKERE